MVDYPAPITIRDEQRPWDVEFPEYDPPKVTDTTVAAGPVWADKEHDSDIKFNELDGKVDRRSHWGEYALVEDSECGENPCKRPRNPCGRTGRKGRGLLGRWGPNHAADPIVTRWTRHQGIRVMKNGKDLLEFVAIKRKDNGQWAIPGGMVDPGESVSVTLKREFGEEALNTLELNKEDRETAKAQIAQLFANGVEVYKGINDRDPRNTDNAWVETVAMNFHDETGELTKAFKLSAGDDAGAVRWMPVDRRLELYSSHLDYLEKVALLHDADF